MLRPQLSLVFPPINKIFLAFVSLVVLWQPAAAQRRPVLPQIDLPHPYYFREMYLPQLTSGPSSVAWSPDSKELVYSMGGSLWLQKIDSNEAQQLTDGPGYDYQPDWSPDGKSVVYVSYQKDAMELWLLDLETGKTQQLTNGGAVNVEPRWSPDGKRIVFVSTAYNKRFHIFRASVSDGKLENVVRLTGETKSDLPRYYYSAFDMEISPVWMRDGTDILFVSNRGHIHGTGGFWRVKAEPGAKAREIHYEETNWKSRPDFSPDGSRMIYSSYLGGQWHNLWLMPASGGDAFPLTYGESDSTSARWSPDGEHIVCIVNSGGNTALRLVTIPGGTLQSLKILPKYLRPVGFLKVLVQDEKGRPTYARVSVTASDGRACIPRKQVIRADDAFDRSERAFEAHYVETTGDENFAAPAGKVELEVMKGFEYGVQRPSVEVKPGIQQQVVVRLSRLPAVHPEGERWVSSDLHVHMNYGGTYSNASNDLVRAAQSENLQIVNNLIVNKEQRFPDIDESGAGLDQASTARELVLHGQEFHTSYWGHRGLLGIRGHILLPGYAGYPNTAAASLYPMNADVYDLAHAQGAVVGAVHPFDEPPDPFAKPAQRITDELPVDVALGKLDYMEIVGFSDHRSTAAVWYRLLNLGFRIPAGAGTDAMANFASLRGPIGMNRVYARVAAGPVTIERFLDALKSGRTFATNGPLLDFSLGNEEVGGELNLDEPTENVPFRAQLQSIVPVDHVELVCNGVVVTSLISGVGGGSDGPTDKVYVSGTVPLKESGWCVLRAWSDKAEYPVLDNYVYATTSPIYVTIGGKKPQSPADAKYFVAWIERMMDTTSHYPDWNSAAEKEYVMGRLEEGKRVFARMQ
jgi:TolB protein